MITEKTYASEAQHWYHGDTGLPCHQVPNKSKPGEFRNTTLRDARVMNLVPSVSAILSIQAKPGLDNWRSRQIGLAAYKLSEGLKWCGGSDEQDFITTVLQDAEIQMSKARDLGTEIHGAIERCLKFSEVGFDLMKPGGVVKLDHSAHINAAISALKEFGVWGQPFRAERSFASPLGYGGCLDFCTDTHISDFKCVDSLSKKLDYNDRLSQLSAYSMGVHGKLVKCANVFISTSEPGQYLLREWTKEELEWGWNLFMACKHLWEVSNRYIPALSQPK